jgi:hypothetical protein
MVPKMLSLELPYLLSICVFLIALPCLVGFVAFTLGPKTRAVICAFAVFTTGAYGLWFGQAVGRSKAWYHWRSQYQDPLFDWQLQQAQLIKNHDTNELMRMAQEFQKERISGYGREPLFGASKFHEFVDRLEMTPQRK